MKYKRIVSQYDGDCEECGEEYEEGEDIYWKKGHKALCLKCGSRYGSNQDRNETTTTPSSPVGSPPVEDRTAAIERMHGEKMVLLKAIADKLQIVAEQVSLVADKQQKRNELLEAKGAK